MLVFIYVVELINVLFELWMNMGFLLLKFSDIRWVLEVEKDKVGSSVWF